MTKRNLSLLLAGLILIFVVILIAKKDQSPSGKNQSLTPAPAVVTPDTLTIDGKKVLGLPPVTDEKKPIEQLKIANKPSVEWKPNLEKTLRAQGGDNVKDIVIKKVDSFVWNHDGIALYVESVVVTVKNQKNEETSFKALVDAQNGKILKNWDQPIFDPIHPKDNFKVRIDPRYHNE